MDVQEAMQALTALERSALVLTAVIGLDGPAAAAVLETSPGAIRSATSRARAKLEASS
jgi:DNA-directed RNA polymerase specialized sigma24 family protein